MKMREIYVGLRVIINSPNSLFNKNLGTVKAVYPTMNTVDVDLDDTGLNTPVPFEPRKLLREVNFEPGNQGQNPE